MHYYNNIKLKHDPKGLKDAQVKKSGYIQYEFVKEDLTDLLAITDTVISRAGSNAIYEFLNITYTNVISTIRFK